MKFPAPHASSLTKKNQSVIKFLWSTKVVQRIVKFQILDFCLPISLILDHVGVKVSNDISYDSIHQIHLEGVSTKVKRI